MSGHHSTPHHVPSFNANSTTNSQPHHSHPTHHHRLTRGSVNASSALAQQDMRVAAFPIDPNLSGPSPTHTTASAAAAAAGLSTPPGQALPSFQHHYDTRPASGGGDPRSHYNSYPQEYHQQAASQHHQTPQTEYSGYDTSFGTDDQGTPTTATVLPTQSHQQSHNASTTTPVTDPESQEIRRLAFAALTESIEALANRTRAEENGPNGEKARQMFGMSWLMRNCEASAGATPRNRVYARYVSLCASERLKPLNPASFGKLVRAVYPDIKTRRLGVRGQSKYHYCGIKLRDDDPNAPTPDVSGDVDDGLKYDLLKDVLTCSLKSRPSSVVPGFQTETTPPPGVPTSDQDDHNWLPRVKNATLRFVSFPSAQENQKSSSENFQVPSLAPFVPAGMDMDAVNTLSALYITHTVGLIEAIRYVKMKQVLHHKFNLTPVFESDLWVSRDSNGSCSTSLVLPSLSALGPKSGFRNVQSKAFSLLCLTTGNHPYPLPASPPSRPAHHLKFSPLPLNYPPRPHPIYLLEPRSTPTPCKAHPCNRVRPPPSPTNPRQRHRPCSGSLPRESRRQGTNEIGLGAVCLCQNDRGKRTSLRRRSRRTDPT